LVEAFRVGLLLTERCNIACRHCWFCSGPEKTATMTLDEAEGYVEQASEIPTVEWISFTGGEPFLLPDMLVELVGLASGRGLRTECVTNCFWAENEEDASSRLSELVDAGLHAINISADDFHQEFIPFSHIGNCYRAAKSLGLKIVIMCTTSRSSALKIGNIRERLGNGGIQIIGSSRPAGGVTALAVESAFIPAGRGASIPRGEWLVGESSVTGPCGDVLRDIGVAPGGRVLPCCSAAGLVDYVGLGNANEGSLGELLEEAGDRRVFKVLFEEGPAELARLLGAGYGGYVGRCHLCHEVLRDPRLPGMLEERAASG
jgi:hypothetical protein